MVKINPTKDTIMETNRYGGTITVLVALLFLFLSMNSLKAQYYTYLFNPTSMSFDNEGRSGSGSTLITYTSPDGLEYMDDINVVSDQSWIHIEYVDTQNGMISISCDNNFGPSRTGHVGHFVDGDFYYQPVTITQACGMPYPGPISGTGQACRNSTQSYTISPVTGATSYNWAITNGNIISGQGTTNVTVSFGAETSSGIVVQAYSSTCGYSGTTGTTVTFLDAKINSHPDAATVYQWQSATFTVAATDATSYQWQENSVNIPGATSSSFTKNNVSVADNGKNYRCVVGNSCGNITSNQAQLTVISTFPTIVSHPSPTNVCDGESTTLSVVVSNATGYQWQVSKDNATFHDIPVSENSSATSSLLRFNVSMSDNGNYYRCNTINSNGSTLSNSAMLSVFESYGTTYTLNTTSTQNYILTVTPQKPSTDLGVTTFLTEGNRQSDQVTDQIVYYDGLGRPVQSIVVKGSPKGKDIMQHTEYDEFGRQSKEYLPFTLSNIGAYLAKTTVEDELADFYVNPPTDVANGGGYPYSEKVFENSPLNRILKQGAPGEPWQPNNLNPAEDRSIKMSYESNETNEVVLFTYDPNTDMISTTEHYEPNQLYKNKTLDEHNNEVIEYVDKQGRTVLKKVQYKTETDGTKRYAETYYIYDDFGNLVVVLPPEAVKQMGTLFSQN